MNIEILNENQNNLESFKKAIMKFTTPKILEAQMQYLEVLDKNINEARSENKNAHTWIKCEASQLGRDEFLAFFKRYEKCYNRIESFSQKFMNSTIGEQLENCKNLLTENFKTKANFNAQVYALAVGNFNSDIHTKTILVEEKYQKGAINANGALDYMAKLQNGYNQSDFAGNDKDLKHLLGTYRTDYAKKAAFKNEGAAYSPDGVLNSTTVSICKSEAAGCAELQQLMTETSKTIAEFYEKLDVAGINNLLIDARQFVASFGSLDWNEREANKFMDMFESKCADLEKLTYEILNCQNRLAELILKIKDKQKQTEEANKQVEKNEVKKRLKTLNENIDKVNLLMKKRTPCNFLAEHLRVLTNDYENIKKALGAEVDKDISKILALTKERLEGLTASVHEAESAQEKPELEKEKILEVKIDFEEDKKPKK